MLSNVFCEYSNEVLLDEQMKNHTTLGVGGNAKYFFNAKSVNDINKLTEIAKANRIKYKIIGNGSNLLVSDNGYNGLIICTKNLKDVYIEGNSVTAYAGLSINKLISFCLNNGLSGLESLSGIPATVGGAVVMNAGAFNCSVSDCLDTVECIKKGRLIKYYKDECKFSYRKSRFTGKETVIKATFNLIKEETSVIRQRILDVFEERNARFPQGKTCGSVFKNLKDVKVAKLIENLNLKGVSVGGATVSDKHCNFIVNNKDAKAIDVYLLIQFIKQKVKDKYNISLIEEVEYLGEF